MYYQQKVLVKYLTLFKTILHDTLSQNLTYILSSFCFTMHFWVFLILSSPILKTSSQFLSI